MATTLIVTYKDGEDEYITINYPFHKIIKENGWLYVIGFNEKITYDISPKPDWIWEHGRLEKRIRKIPIHTFSPDYNQPHLIVSIRLKTIRLFRFED